MTAVLVALDAIGDTRLLWDDWLADAERVTGITAASLPPDRGEAAAILDRGEAGNWRTLLERFAEDRAPVYLRPSAEVSAALRRLVASGATIGVFTDAPVELATVALAQLGAARRVEQLETGTGALDRLRSRLGDQARVVTTRAGLVGTTP